MAYLCKRSYEAAAAYYKAAPWKKLPQKEFAIEIRYPEEAESRYGIIIGRGGESFGLSVNDTLDELKHFYTSAQGFTSEEGKYSVVSFTYEKAYLLPFEDLDMIDKYACEIVNKEAYPSVLRVKPRSKQILPLKKEDVFWLTGALLALADFFCNGFDADDFLLHFGTREDEVVVDINGLSGKEKVFIKLPLLL